VGGTNGDVVAGNSGDLMTGLPWQSVHDGTSFQHEPMRMDTYLIVMGEQGVASRFDGQRRWSDVLQQQR
jgi:hypothetical protein